jgi:hypothetical protein
MAADYDDDDDDFRDDRDDDYEPDPTDYLEQEAMDEYWRHCDEAHGGKPCTCPPGEPPAPEPPGGYSDEPPF